ncbi:MAG: YjbQ family protein, partial [Erysipelotrichaceae bacterium]|nr:YjbQ family protein [Erysipelotrichaceae bacterium]
NHMVKEREPYYEHTMEGSDDMPAHAKCSLFGVSLTIPIPPLVLYVWKLNNYLLPLSLFKIIVSF